MHKAENTPYAKNTLLIIRICCFLIASVWASSVNSQTADKKKPEPKEVALPSMVRGGGVAIPLSHSLCSWTRRLRCYMARDVGMA